MTHWLVKLAKIGTAFKKVGGAIKDNYEQDKRPFIESIVSLSFNTVFVVAVLNWIVFPIPPIPKYTAPISPFQLEFVVLKPFWLHILALAGCLFFLNPRIGLSRPWIHVFFSIIIKVRNYYIFVRKGRRKISN